MYKILVVSLILVFFTFLTSCGQSQSDIDAAKQKLLWWENSQIQEPSGDSGTPSETETNTNTTTSENTTPIVETSKASDVIEIIPQTAEQFLKFDSIDESKLKTGELEIWGKTMKNVDKIQVLFSNRASDFPNDDYILQTFTPGDDTFRYVASSRNKVLDFGENTYTFRAFSGKEITETRIMVRVNETIQETPEEVDETQGETETQLIGSEDDTVLIDLPTSTDYGEPVKLWEDSFTYSQIKGLELSKEVFEKPSCAGLTDFLRDRINNWFYWNTCRDLVAGKGIYYNVIRLDGEEYFYERHYVDFEHGFYATYELERGEWVTTETIAAKNTELRDTAFENTSVVDKLLRDIVQS